MEKRKPITNSDELFHRINRLGSEAEWTDEELREALREGGVDPEQLVSSVRARFERLKNSSQGEARQATEGQQEAAAPLPLLGELREQTGMRASQIAEAMGVTVPFLSAVARYPKAVPGPWHDELVARAERKLPGVKVGPLRRSLEHPFQAEMAANRDTAYAAEEVDYENILDQSGLTDEQKQFWRSLI
ncbi:MAG: hypothetical protein M3362_01115 [Acidobacteriota bacterium]|nr:hypothetical protein [Acidobacteriota bacterium]